MDVEEPDAGRVKRAEVDRRMVSVSVISQWSLEALVYSDAIGCELVVNNVCILLPRVPDFVTFRFVSDESCKIFKIH